jgi:hypothetical protein
MRVGSVIDPPNYLASVIAVLQLTGSVINICYDYQSTVRHASKDIEHIRQQLVSFHDVLEHLVSIVVSEPTDTALPHYDTSQKRKC